MAKTIEDYYNDKTGLPSLSIKTSIFTILLNFVLRLMYKTAKAIYSAAQRMFQSGFDNKTIIKEK